MRNLTSCITLAILILNKINYIKMLDIAAALAGVALLEGLVDQGWASYGPRARRPTEIQTPTVNQAEDFFLLFTDF